MAKKTEYEVLLEMAAKLDPSYRTAMENAKKGVKDVGKSGKEAADDIDVFDIALGNLVANGISALISKAFDAARSLYGLAEETREFRQDMGTLETAFSEAGFSAETATDTWEDLYAVFGEDDRAVEAANNISRMADNEQELADWVEITTGIWGTYQDALPVEGLAEAAGETAKVGKITGVMADALNWGAAEGETFGVVLKANTKKNKEWNDAVNKAASAEDYFNLALQECTTEAERQALINETLLNLYGDAAKKYEETAGSVMDANRAQAEYTQTQAEFGERIEPVTVAVKKGVTDLMTAALQLFSDVDFAAWASKIEQAFGWIINTGLPYLLNTAIPWLKSNLPAIGVAIAGIGAAFIAFNFASIIGGITGAFKGLWMVMAANPVGMIILGITALVTGFMLLWNNCEGFRNFWIGLWEKIKAAAAAVAEWFTGTFVPWLSGVWDSISAGAQFIGEIFSGLHEAWSSAFKGAANAVIRVLNWLIGKVNTISIGPLPDWGILGEYAGAEIGFHIPEIPELAKGGIAMSDTLARVGEGAEPEAILPLSKLGDLLGGTSEPVSIVYSPQITVMPGANGADVENALGQSFEQFKAYMDRYLRERKRLQFS